MVKPDWTTSHIGFNIPSLCIYPIDILLNIAKEHILTTRPKEVQLQNIHPRSLVILDFIYQDGIIAGSSLFMLSKQIYIRVILIFKPLISRRLHRRTIYLYPHIIKFSIDKSMVITNNKSWSIEVLCNIIKSVLYIVY